MSRSKHTEAQIIGALKQIEAGRSADDVAGSRGSASTDHDNASFASFPNSRIAARISDSATKDRTPQLDDGERMVAKPEVTVI